MVERQENKQVVPPYYLAWQGVRIGAAAAMPGVAIGSIYGTLRTETPVLFSLVSGMQWFAIGTTYWTVRSSILNRDGLSNWWALTRGAPLRERTDLNPSNSAKVQASTISGAITGAALGAAFRGHRNVIPGTIMFSLFGFGGQHAFNYLDRANLENVREERALKEEGKVRDNWLQRIAKKSWSPFTALTPEEFEDLMGEKLLYLQAQIALIDERIEEYRKKMNEEKAQGQANAQNQEKK